jgi:acid phosphatase (class A)
MNQSLFLPNRSRRRVFSICLLAGWILTGAVPPAQAEFQYLHPGQPDGIALLAPPPEPGSAEAAADLATVSAAFKGRSADEEARAVRDSSLSFSLFASGIGPEFRPENLPKTHQLLQKVKKEIGIIIDTPKNHWKRRRPYELDKDLSLGQPETSFSYPSGHSTRGTVYSLVLAELFPDRREAILAIGRDIGWDRVIIGKHFPTDIYAGRVLGKAIVREFLASPEFQRDLAAAKAELLSGSKVSAGEARNN